MKDSSALACLMKSEMNPVNAYLDAIGQQLVIKLKAGYGMELPIVLVNAILHLFLVLMEAKEISSLVNVQFVSLFLLHVLNLISGILKPAIVNVLQQPALKT